MFKVIGALACAAVGVSAMAPAMAAEVDGPRVHWNYSSWGKYRASSPLYAELGPYLSKKTGGQFTVEVHYGTLSKPKANLDGIQLGAFQAATYCASYYPGKLEAATGLDLPFLPISTLSQLAMVAEDFNKHPAVVAEFDKWNGINYASSVLPLYEVVGKGEPPTGLDDWKGMRLRALGMQGTAFEQLGAVPTNVPAPDVYTSMDRGLLDAASFAYYSHDSYRTYELGNWFTKGLAVGSINCGTIINKDAYNSLPDQYKKLVDSYKMERGYPVQITVLNRSLTESPKKFREAGLTEIDITPEMHDEFAKVGGKPVWDEWVAKMNDLGHDGAGMLQLLLTSSEKHKDASFPKMDPVKPVF